MLQVASNFHRHSFNDHQLELDALDRSSRGLAASSSGASGFARRKQNRSVSRSRLRRRQVVTLVAFLECSEPFGNLDLSDGV